MRRGCTAEEPTTREPAERLRLAGRVQALDVFVGEVASCARRVMFPVGCGLGDRNSVASQTQSLGINKLRDSVLRDAGWKPAERFCRALRKTDLDHAGGRGRVVVRDSVVDRDEISLVRE